MPPRTFLSPVLQRRLAVAIRHRPTTSIPFRTYATVDSPARGPTLGRRLRTDTTPSPAALSALLSRLSLKPNTQLHQAVISCLTHPSYLSIPSSSTLQTDTELESNELLATLGNTLLGLFASEHLTSQFPYLPTEALKQAVTAYVGPATCLSVARELGLAASGGGNLGFVGQGPGSASAGIPVRFHRTREDQSGHSGRGEVSDGPEKIPSARRFRKFEEGAKERSDELEGRRILDKRKARNREGFEDVVASAVRAFVGLIYQEEVSL
jgi:large subunit ribosomal protein L44